MGAQRLTWRWRLLAGFVIGLTWLLRWRVDVQDLHHVPTRGGAVLAFNHHSYLDFVMIAWAPVRLLRRPVRFLAKREIWSSRKLGWLVRWAEAVPVDRGSSRARADAFDAAAAALAGGDLVAVAPEQTISRSFELLPMRTGAARMAQLSGAPIVPVIGWGTQRVLTKGSRLRLVRRLPVTLWFGEPLRVGPDDEVVAATTQLRERMTAMLHEAQGTYPDGTPEGAPWVPARLGGGAPIHAEVLRDHEARSSRWFEPRPEDGTRTRVRPPRRPRSPP